MNSARVVFMISQQAKQNSAQDLSNIVEQMDRQTSSTVRTMPGNVSPELYKELPPLEPSRDLRQSPILLPTFIEIL